MCVREGPTVTIAAASAVFEAFASATAADDRLGELRHGIFGTHGLTVAESTAPDDLSNGTLAVRDEAEADADDGGG
jgi:hypothetical protein